MKLYNSYIKKTPKGDVRDLIFIKNGFSFPALFFNFLYFFYHNMIKWVFGILLVDILLIYLIGIYKPSAFDILIIFVSTSLIIAANANYWHSKYLRAKGYEFIGCVFGDNKEAAKLRFVEGYMDRYDEKTIAKYKFLKKEDRPFFNRKSKEDDDIKDEKKSSLATKKTETSVAKKSAKSAPNKKLTKTTPKNTK